MRAAFYECDVTPPLGGYMWGYYCRRLADDVADRLYSRAVVIESEEGLSAIVSIDTCVIPREMHDIVTQRIYEYTGIAPENVCITSNHTHRGAPVFDSPELDSYADKAYTDVFYRLTADAVILAYKRLEEATLSFAIDEVYGVSYNRISVLCDGSYETNSQKPRKGTLAEIDPSLSIIKVEVNSKCVGAIVNYALHQDTAEPISGYTGDFASVISDRLKEEYGRDFVTVFALGTCGDINHLNYDELIQGKNELYAHKRIGRAIAEKAIEAMAKATPLSGAIAAVKEKITIKKRLTKAADTIERLRKYADIKAPFFWQRNLMYYCSTNRSEDYEMYIQVFKIGDVCIYCLPGEIYVNWGFMIKEKSKFQKNIVIQNCNTYLGYVPTPEAFDESSNIYEIQLCHHSCLVPEAGQLMVDSILSLAEKIK